MLDALRQGRTDPAARRRLRHVLAAGPWLWPPDGGPPFEAACRIADLAAPPNPEGRVPVVTVREQTATLWYLDSPRVPGHANLGAVASRSWDQARAALPRSLPVLLSSLRPHQTPPSVVRLASHIARSGWARLETVIEGPSLGLAFFLHLVARVSRVPVVADAVASASIDETGRLGPVTGLPLKIDAVARTAPRIRRFLVCAEQEAEAREAAEGRLEVLAFKSAAEATEALYNEALLARLIDCSPSEQRRIGDTLLRLVLTERGLTSWSPVRHAARRARRTWHSSSDEGYLLQFVEAVAARHEENRGELDVPPRAWLERLPRPVRSRVIAHVVQHAADTGSPQPEQALALARQAVPNPPHESFAPELAVHGAIGRLLAATGRPEEALSLQAELARAQFAGFSYDEVSRPLCEWLRLAAALGDRQAFDAALEFRQRLETVGAMGPGDDAFLALATSRGEVILDPRTSPRALHRLARLANSPAIPDHVRRSAARWRLRTTRLADASAQEQADARADLDAACPPDSAAPEVRVFRELARLDEALALGDAATAQATLAELQAISPALIANLTAHVPEDARPAHVALFYPY